MSIHKNKINLNNKVKVKLTSLGVKIHFDHYNKVNEEYQKQIVKMTYCMPVIDEEGYTEYQLWEFMNIFGNHLYNGSENVIFPIEIMVT